MEKENTFQQIRELIEQSALSVEEQKEFVQLFAQTKEDALEPVYTLFKKDPEWIEVLYQNYAAKKKAMITGSMDAWKEVIAQEKNHIE